LVKIKKKKKNKIVARLVNKRKKGDAQTERKEKIRLVLTEHKRRDYPRAKHAQLCREKHCTAKALAIRTLLEGSYRI